MDKSWGLPIVSVEPPLPKAGRGTNEKAIAMSMIGCFYALSDEDLNAIMDQPKRVERLWAKEMAQFEREKPAPSFWSKLFGAKPAAKQVDDDPWQPGPAEAFDVDKAWHGIHFLLTGSEWEGAGPLAFVLHGGREIKHDLGYGSPHGFSAAEVKEIARALADLDLKALYERADPAEFTRLEIYPTIYNSEPKEECIGYVIDNLKDLREFVQQTAAANRALIAYLG